METVTLEYKINKSNTDTSTGYCIIDLDYASICYVIFTAKKLFNFFVMYSTPKIWEICYMSISPIQSYPVSSYWFNWQVIVSCINIIEFGFILVTSLYLETSQMKSRHLNSRPGLNTLLPA